MFTLPLLHYPSSFLVILGQAFHRCSAVCGKMNSALHISCWFIPWMQRVIRSQPNLWLLHWQIHFWEETTLSHDYTSFYIAPLEADKIKVLFAVYLPKYPMWASRVSALGRKYLLALVSQIKGALFFRRALARHRGELIGDCTGIWGQARQQNL